MSNDDVQEAEIVSETARPLPATTPAPTDGGGSLALFGTTDPVEMIDKAKRLAEPLAALIEERNLFVSIKGRKHVRVEGWTLLGSMLGALPIERVTRQVTDADGKWREPTFREEERTNDDGETYMVRVLDEPGRGGWEARVEIVRGGEVIAGADMECRWSEKIWADRDSFAVRSMAQTRATSKALRLALSFVMELAGFATTPAEEMSGSGRLSQAPIAFSTSSNTARACTWKRSRAAGAWNAAWARAATRSFRCSPADGRSASRRRPGCS